MTQHEPAIPPPSQALDPERIVDWFIPVVGALGLGLLALLVYIYWL